jgi:hypothetical protein
MHGRWQYHHDQVCELITNIAVRIMSIRRDERGMKEKEQRSNEGGGLELELDMGDNSNR